MSLVQQLTSGSDQRVALQFAFYNILLLALAGICLAGLYAVYKMMYMFLTPLLWATLIGTILFPLKKRFRNSMNGWLSRVDREETPLPIAILLAPFDAVMSATDLFLGNLGRRDGIVILVTFLILKLLSHGMFVSIIHLFGDLYQNIDYVIQFFSKTWISILMVLYFAAFFGWLYVQDENSVNKKLARLISIPLWIFGLATISGFCGPFRVIVMIAISTVLGIIAAGILTAEDVKEDANVKKTDTVTLDDDLKTAAEAPGEKKDTKTLDQALTGDFYVQAILGLCALEFAVRHDFVIVLITFLAVFGVFRKIGMAVAEQTGLTAKIHACWKAFHEKARHYMHVAIAGRLRDFFKLFFSSDQLMKNSLRNGLDDLATVLVMLFLVVGSLTTVFVVAFQVHSEVAHLMRLGANLLSQQPEWMMDYARNYTGNQLEESDIDNYVEQGYLKGREWLATNVRSFVGAKDPTKAALLEEQVTELVDKLYQMWEDRNKKDMSSFADDVTGKDWMSHLKGFTSISTLKQEAIELVKENVDTIMSVAQSVWSVVAANISILGTILFALLTIVINFGIDILNFFIEIVVFLTALYYLLASSQNIWLPIKWVNDAIPRTLPPSDGSAPTDSSATYSTTDITTAIENAISGVFVLSAKMSIFYGLYTYFVHALFDINVVFIPTILAAIFAAIPIMAPHVVCIFGFLELYFAEHETAAAILFVLASFAPKLFADAAFYKELRGSHPYVTGLAIIGGMYWLGLQGAIIGPIVLCSMIVLLNVYSKFANA